MKYISRLSLTEYKNEVVMIIPSLTAYFKKNMWSMRFVISIDK